MKTKILLSVCLVVAFVVAVTLTQTQAAPMKGTRPMAKKDSGDPKEPKEPGGDPKPKPADLAAVYIFSGPVGEFGNAKITTIGRVKNNGPFPFTGNRTMTLWYKTNNSGWTKDMSTPVPNLKVGETCTVVALPSSAINSPNVVDIKLEITPADKHPSNDVWLRSQQPVVKGF